MKKIYPNMVPAYPGFSVLVPTIDEDNTVCNVELEPVVAWAFDGEGIGPVPVTLSGQNDAAAIVDPNGGVYAGDTDYQSVIQWLLAANKRERKRAG